MSEREAKLVSCQYCSAWLPLDSGCPICRGTGFMRVAPPAPDRAPVPFRECTCVDLCHKKAGSVLGANWYCRVEREHAERAPAATPAEPLREFPFTPGREPCEAAPAAIAPDVDGLIARLSNHHVNDVREAAAMLATLRDERDSMVDATEIIALIEQRDALRADLAARDAEVERWKSGHAKDCVTMIQFVPAFGYLHDAIAKLGADLAAARSALEAAQADARALYYRVIEWRERAFPGTDQTRIVALGYPRVAAALAAQQGESGKGGKHGL